MSMYITFTWQRPAISSRADARQGRARAGPQTPGTWELGQITTSGSPAAGPILSSAGGGGPAWRRCRVDRVRPHARARSCGRRLLAGSRRTSAKAVGGRRGAAPHPSRHRRRCRLGAIANARADVGPRSSRGRIREGQPSRSAVARAPPHGCPATACCRLPAGAGRQRAQGRRQPSGWCVDGIVVTCSDPAQRCRAAPAAALGEPVFAEW